MRAEPSIECLSVVRIPYLQFLLYEFPFSLTFKALLDAKPRNPLVAELIHCLIGMSAFPSTFSAITCCLRRAGTSFSS